MTTSEKFFARFPKRIEISSGGRSSVFELVPGRYANDVRGKNPAVVEGEPKPNSDEIGPVYELKPAGGDAIPTGRVFVRFRSDVTASERRHEIEGSGYEIDEIVSYAPEAVWVRAASGDIADALSDLSKLQKLTDVENVEPQMLMRRATK
jgi:hypothetical protein